MPKPLLAVITGRPGAGKSTLAPEIARRLSLPLLGRDTIKELLPPGDQLQIRATDAFFAEIKLRLELGLGVVAEAAFQHPVWSARLEPLRALAEIRIVVCDVDFEIAKARAERRAAENPEREAHHPIAEITREYRAPQLEFLTLRVDTRDGYEPGLDDIEKFFR